MPPAEEIIVTGAPLLAQSLPRSGPRTVLAGEALAQLPYRALDQALAASTGFSLFRRLDSQVANPTIQGATLRGIGPNGAGRAVVLLDGAPLNDPFGNWVNWASVPLQSVDMITLERGARQVTMGAGALSGLVALERGQSPAGTQISLAGSSLPGFDGYLGHSAELGKVRASAFVSGGQRAGYILLPEDQRGPADVTTASHNVAGGVRLAVDLGPEMTLSTSLRGFSEKRDNGLDGAGNETDGFDGSVRLRFGTPGSAFTADALAYGQVRQFASLFTATDAARETTRPVLDQFSVPAHAYGARLQAAWTWVQGQTSQIFAQVDSKSGETNERFRNLGAGFTRQRQAGGSQLLYGLGVAHSAQLSETLIADVGARVDGFSLTSGMRRESDLASGAVLRDDVFEDRAQVLPGGDIGLTWQPLPAWRVLARGYTGYRLASLNELYRPFRVGNDITEANPQLEAERLYGVDLGARFEPINGQVIDITLFMNWLNDAVGNVTVPGAGGFVAPCGFVPGNGSCRQRGNIDNTRVEGAEIRLASRVNAALSFDVNYAFTRAQVRNDDLAPQLAGQRLPQVPRHSGRAAAHIAAASTPLEMTVALRFATRQFEDDLNLRQLDGFLALDISARWPLSDAVTLTLDGVNLTDTQIDAGRTASGLITRGQPAMVTLGLNAAF